MIEREARPDRGFDYPQDDPYEDDGWFGRELVTDSISVDEVAEPPRSEPVHHVGEERDEPPPPTRRLAPPTVNTWTINGQLRASNNSTLTFRPPPAPWYRTKQATIAFIAVAAAAVAVPLVLFVWCFFDAPRPADLGGTTGIHDRRPTFAEHRSADTRRGSPAAATTPAASAATSGRGRRLRGYPAVPAGATCCTRANSEAGYRGDAHACDSGTDQCGAAATAITRQQLGHSRGRPKA